MANKDLKTLYVAMFDKVNEGAEIFKGSNNNLPCQRLKLVPYQQESNFYIKRLEELLECDQVIKYED